MKKVSFTLCSLLAISYGMAAIIHVPGEQPTIQAGINAAMNGDTVLVDAGTYFENLTYGGKNITVASYFLLSQDTTYIAQTIINGGGNALSTVVVFENGEDSTAVLTGFTITNGCNYHGGGIYCMGASPLLSYLTISDNSTHFYNGYSRAGGGIYCENSGLILRYVNIHNNTAIPACPTAGLDCGGGIYLGNSDITMQHVSIHNNMAESGGGIHCDNSSPVMLHVNIYDNTVIPDMNPLWWAEFDSFGGGMSCVDGSNPVIMEVTIRNNVAHSGYYPGSKAFGGGMYCSVSSPVLQHVTLAFNSAGFPYQPSGEVTGGGIHCTGASPVFQDVFILNNSGWSGGGICFDNSNPVLENVLIANNSANSGGGLYCNGSGLEMQNVTVAFNSASNDGGGIYCASSTPGFDTLNRCNVYLNHAVIGNDVYSDTVFHLVVDTFTVLIPTDYHLEPLENFTLNILNGKYNQVNADLYVSPEGDNANSGLTVNDPLKNIWYANTIIRGDSLNNRTLHLLQGTYSDSANQERFPANIPDYINLRGVSEKMVFLDAGGQADNILIYHNAVNHIEQVTLSGGKDKGVSMINSNPLLHHISLTGNPGTALHCDGSSPDIDSVKITASGVGISCDNGSHPDIQHAIVSGNGNGITCDHGSSPSIVKAVVAGNGSGITCSNGSSPSLSNVQVNGNSGHGIRCESLSEPSLENVTIMDNSGSGIACIYASPVLQGVTISGNSTEHGGGLYCDHSSPELEQVIIMDNMASEDGGGIYCSFSSPIMDSVIIADNTALLGGGVFCSGQSAPYLESVTIRDNFANEGGGIYCSSSVPVFDGTNRCDIYMNKASIGNDLYADTSTLVVVDTFSVLYPNGLHAFPLGNFTFDILHGYREQVNADLYVSPEGDDANSGLTVNDPLKTIHCALLIILADSLDQHTIHLLEGTYSDSLTGEIFPLVMCDYVSLSGESEETVVMDAAGFNGVIIMDHTAGTYLSDLTITGGTGTAISLYESTTGLQDITLTNYYGNGIDCYKSSPLIENVTLVGNGGGYGLHCDDGSDPYIHYVEIASNGGRGILCTNNSNPVMEHVHIHNNAGGMLCSYSSPVLRDVLISDNGLIGHGGGILCTDYSSPYLDHVTLTGNHAGMDWTHELGCGGGIYCYMYSSPTLSNVTLYGNDATKTGGGIYLHGHCNPQLLNVLIFDNWTSLLGGGFASYFDCNPILTNVTIANNTAEDEGGGMYIQQYSDPVMFNSVVWGNTPDAVHGNTMVITWSDIQGGWAGEGNIDADPLFTGTGDFPFSLSDYSPCINAGKPDTTGMNLPELDLAGNPRIYGARIDMGAYENQNVTTSNTQPLTVDDIQFSCLPNPFSDELTITYYLPAACSTKIEIYNAEGKKVGEAAPIMQPVGVHVCRVSTHGLPAGVYIVRFKAGDRIIPAKIILQ